MYKKPPFIRVHSVDEHYGQCDFLIATDTISMVIEIDDGSGKSMLYFRTDIGGGVDCPMIVSNDINQIQRNLLGAP